MLLDLWVSICYLINWELWRIFVQEYIWLELCYTWLNLASKCMDIPFILVRTEVVSIMSAIRHIFSICFALISLNLKFAGEDKHVVFVSGLSVGGSSSNPLQFQLLIDHITGHLGDEKVHFVYLQSVTLLYFFGWLSYLLFKCKLI